MKKASVFLAFLLGLSSSPVQALDLGSGVTCISKEILLNGKYKNPSTVKNSIKRTIKKERSKLSNLKKNKNKNKEKIAASNLKISTSKILITDIDNCTKGVLALEDFFNQISGRFKGFYTGTLKPITLEGDITVTFTVVGLDVILDIEFGGSLSEIVPTGATKLAFSLKNKSFPAIFELKGTTLGDVSLKFSEDGKFNLIAQNMPKEDFATLVLNFDGKFLDFNSRFEGDFKAGSTALPGVFVLVGDINFAK